MRSDKAIEAKRALTEICKMRFESKENTRVLKARLLNYGYLDKTII